MAKGTKPVATTTLPKETWNDFAAQFVPKSYKKFGIKVQLVGYAETIKKVEKEIKLLLDDETSAQDPTLITGPSGTGKTIVVRSLAESYVKNRPELRYFYLKSSWTLEKSFGRSRLLQLFDEAVEEAPSIIFIDDIDQICSEKRNEIKDRIFSALEDGIEMLKLVEARVLVLAATNRPELLDPQIRGRFNVDEIKFTLPTQSDRRDALDVMTKKLKLQLSDEDITQIANMSQYYSYRNLNELCLKAEKIRTRAERSPKEAMFSAISEYKPLKIRSITTSCALRWDDVGGIEKAKRELQQSVVWPLKHRDTFEQLGIKLNKGILLYGPPGCSKTMLAQALATESGYNFISVKGPELYTKWVGDTEAAVRKLYRDAREISPCIIFLDEIDGFAPKRSDSQNLPVGDKVVTTLLAELDGIEPLDNVFTIGATNRPDRVDEALLRFGRLDPAIYIPLPDEDDRVEIFKVHMKPMRLRFDKSIEEVISDLSKQTRWYSGAEIANICRVAGISAMVESLDSRHIEYRHFVQALETVKPRTRANHLRNYAKFHEMTLQRGQMTSLPGPLDELGDDFDRINI